MSTADPRRVASFLQHIVAANVPWSAAYQMRNVLAHAYDKVDLPLVWRTIQTEIPQLRRAVAQLASSLDETYGGGTA